MLGFGFGFVEIGTLTPRPQAGNARPRLFRLAEDRAVINRMGFNNGGFEAAKARLGRRRRRGIVGVNIGANKDSADRIADYVAGVRAMAPTADYLTVNISSPNTPGLRALQDEGALAELLAADRRGADAGRPPSSSRSRPTSGRARSTASPARDRLRDGRADRRQHHGLAAGAALARTGAKPAACRARRSRTWPCGG